MIEPYSVTRESNNKKTTSYSCRSDGRVRFDYEDESAIVFFIFDEIMYILNCDNEIISNNKPTHEYDLNLFKYAVEIYQAMFSRQY